MGKIFQKRSFHYSFDHPTLLPNIWNEKFNMHMENINKLQNIRWSMLRIWLCTLKTQLPLLHWETTVCTLWVNYRLADLYHGPLLWLITWQKIFKVIDQKRITVSGLYMQYFNLEKKTPKMKSCYQNMNQRYWYTTEAIYIDKWNKANWK